MIDYVKGLYSDIVVDEIKGVDYCEPDSAVAVNLIGVRVTHGFWCSNIVNIGDKTYHVHVEYHLIYRDTSGSSVDKAHVDDIKIVDQDSLDYF